MVTPDSPEPPEATVPDIEYRLPLFPPPPPPPPLQLSILMARREKERIRKVNFRKYILEGF